MFKGAVIVLAVMITIGLGILVAGMRGMFYAKRPWNTLAAISLPVGLVTVLVGILLLCVPNFFKG